MSRMNDILKGDAKLRVEFESPHNLLVECAVKMNIFAVQDFVTDTRGKGWLLGFFEGDKLNPHKNEKGFYVWLFVRDPSLLRSERVINGTN